MGAMVSKTENTAALSVVVVEGGWWWGDVVKLSCAPLPEGKLKNLFPTE